MNPNIFEEIVSAFIEKIMQMVINQGPDDIEMEDLIVPQGAKLKIAFFHEDHNQIQKILTLINKGLTITQGEQNEHQSAIDFVAKTQNLLQQNYPYSFVFLYIAISSKTVNPAKEEMLLILNDIKNELNMMLNGRVLGNNTLDDANLNLERAINRHLADNSATKDLMLYLLTNLREKFEHLESPPKRPRN